MTKRIMLLVMGLCCAVSATAQEESFFTDPSLLVPWDDEGTFVLGYVHPDIAQIGQRYDSVMVDQPEIIVADDSKYKGAKPDHLKQLADSARSAMIERIESGGWPIVEEPGSNVVFIRWAISDLYLKKKKKNLLAYTPVGFVVHSTRQATLRDLWKKIDIVELGLKIEWSDSVSGDVFSAGESRQGLRKAKGRKVDLVSWEEIDALFLTVGEQTRCHLDNNIREEGDRRRDCDTLVYEPEE